MDFKNKNWAVISVSAFYILTMVITLFYTIAGKLPEVVNFVIPSWYNTFVYVAFLIYAAGFVFIITMKKWALISLTVLSVTLYILFFVTNMFSLMTFIIDVIVFGILWTQFKKMN
ncbi:hypothetical protein HN415_09000 [Candidatus Woesearchaeota archaeon]|jgi:hypothetical protein|nr:hypothetical protein [Candidatus Woesearchaeota archaeon]